MPSDVPDVTTTRSGADGDAARRVLGRDRAARRLDADRRHVAVVAVTERALDGVDQVRRCPEPERNRVTDVQVPHPTAGGLDLPGLCHDVANGVAEAADAGGNGDRGAGRHPGIVAAKGPSLQSRDF